MQAFMAKSMPETTDCALSKEMGAGVAALGRQRQYKRRRENAFLPWDK
jgi:hypothetical protein